MAKLNYVLVALKFFYPDFSLFRFKAIKISINPNLLALKRAWCAPGAAPLSERARRFGFIEILIALNLKREKSG
jgi:hypothetical protein